MKKDSRKIDLLLGCLASIHAHGDAMAAGELVDASVSGFYFPDLED